VVWTALESFPGVKSDVNDSGKQPNGAIYTVVISSLQFQSCLGGPWSKSAEGSSNIQLDEGGVQSWDHEGGST
jgi:hypothetical protein